MMLLKPMVGSVVAASVLGTWRWASLFCTCATKRLENQNASQTNSGMCGGGISDGKLGIGFARLYTYHYLGLASPAAFRLPAENCGSV